jgi:hypothetical protein
MKFEIQNSSDFGVSQLPEKSSRKNSPYFYT